MIKENVALKVKVNRLEEELSSVDWYIEVMEHGVDTKNIAKEYALLKKEHIVLKTTQSKKIKKLEEKLQKTKSNYIDALEKLK